jgi:EAL domain-containing protein (putative c-di-GMP-specific phosphodiesterase class I)
MSDKEAAHVIFITDQKDDYEKLSGMLKDFDFDIEIYVCASVKDLKAYYADKGAELLVYWHKTAAIDEKEITTFMKAMSADPPGLILVSAGIGPADYVQVAALQAVDIVNSEIPAQFPFVIRREIKNVRTKRKLRQVVRKLEDETVADITEYTITEENEDLAPMVSTIDQALKTNRLELLFQPILAVQQDGYDNYEVFLRIRDNNDYVMPKNFLPVAEQYGLMPAIDRWVIKNAVTRFKAEQQVRAIKKQTSRKLRFFVNISGHSLVDEVIMGGIISEIVGARLEPGGFVIEVHKNTILSRLQKVKALNHNIKKLKLQFAIDHYEESDIALNYLRHVELDYIKLNKDLMHGVAGDQKKRSAIREIVKKAREHDIKVIASQVEDASVLPVLYEVGVDYIQGYLVAEPGTRLERAVIDASLDEAASN